MATLCAMMVVTGALTTLCNKYQDVQCVSNCDSPNTSDHQTFEQPIWQTDQMFAGEAACWLVILLSSAGNSASRQLPRQMKYSTLPNQSLFSRLRRRPTNSDSMATFPLIPKADSKEAKRQIHFIALLPAMCDILGTTLLNVGLLFVAPSIQQMTRGTAIFFTALFSVCFLDRRISRQQWLGLVLVFIGVAIVGLAGATKRDALTTKTHSKHLLKRALGLGSLSTSTNHALRTFIGVGIIIVAQIFAAAQSVLQEFILSHRSLSPLELVSYEGISGLTVILTTQLLAYITYGSTQMGQGSVFDMLTGFLQVTHNPHIWITSILMIVATGLFNYFGLKVTKTLSATHRSSIDTFRTLLIWFVGLAVGWEQFKWLQLLGFSGLVVGNAIFNDIVQLPGPSL